LKGHNPAEKGNWWVEIFVRYVMGKSLLLAYKN
jgi:hypothetical protein